MFHSQSRYSNPRDKYLAALEAAKAAETEYLAAQRLQDEEYSLRQRLDQIQLLKQRDFGYTAPHYTNPTPSSFGADLELLRRQIAAEERARIALEQQQQARELEAIRRYEQERRASELELQLRRKAQIARENERARALAAQRARLETLTERASRPTVRFNIVGEEEPVRKHHCRHQHAPAHRSHNEVQDLLSQAFVPRQQKPIARAAPAPATPETITLEDFLGKLVGAQIPAPQSKPAEVTPQAITLEQLLGHVLGAAGVELKPSAPVASTSTAGPSQAPPAEKKAAAPAPSQSATPAPSQPAPAPKPTAHPPPADLFHQLLGGAQAPTDYQQLINMFFGAHPQAQTPNAPEASSSKSAGTSMKQDLEARARAEQSSEDRDLAEAIRLSLAEAEAAPASPSSDKGKAPAPAPVVDIASSAAEVRAIDAAFNTLASDFVFPEELDFSTSRAASPARDGTEPSSAISRLSYSARNHTVRVQHQALSALLARLDAVESFGDESLRHARKEAVGRVEGALDEMESVIESRWRKWAGKERAESPAPVAAEPVAAEPVAAEPVSEPEAVVEAAPVADAVEQVAVEQVALEQVAVEEVAVEEVDELEVAPPLPAGLKSVEAADDVASSESVDTLRPSSPVPSDVDTFLLPASSEQPPSKSTSSDEDVASDWSEVDA